MPVLQPRQRQKSVVGQPPPQALRFSHGRGERETRVTGDEPQGTMGRVQTAGEARLARCLLPAFLCAHIFIKRETSGYEAGSRSYFVNERLSVNIENQAPDQKIRSFFFISQKKNPSGIKTIFKFRSA